jgi:hypothetical protein
MGDNSSWMGIYFPSPLPYVLMQHCQEFLPFNGGHRICLGRAYSPSFRCCDFVCLTGIEQFALTEASYLTVRMLQKFERIELRDERPWTEFYTLVACSKNGTLVSLTPSSV